MGRKKIKITPIQESRPYVLWRRVSTEGQGLSGLGLEAQTTIAKMFMGKDPVEIFTDVYSGTKLKQCKGLWDAIALCKENNYVLVVAKVDRFRSVAEALEVLDAIGDRNIIFCDTQTADRFVLTVLFAMNERQAIIGRVNTKIALAERQKEIHKNGGFTSKKGNWRTRLGNEPGTCYPQAIEAMSVRRTNIAQEWRENSALYAWVTIQVLKKRDPKDILREAKELYDKSPERYCTRKGGPLGFATFLNWKSAIMEH